ncbi:MAG: glycyl-radical enzyme activating protein [Candidatus Binataceae bacterium]
MSSHKSSPAGRIFNVQRHSTEDGPGIRTTVFLKGCPMRCPWCHNPEGMDSRFELAWYKPRCIGAKACIEVCPRGALRLTPEGLEIDRTACDACQLCEKACPAGALEVTGRLATVAELVERVVRDKVFYETSGGGVTLSGGEPAMQPEFAVALMRSLRSEGIHLALDTCGGVGWAILRPVVELADLVLYDLKTLDDVRHRAHLGIPVSRVRENARAVARLGKPMWIRTPIIPGYTDDEENVRTIARFITEALPTTGRYELLAFNNTCAGKYLRLGRSFALADEALVSEQCMEALTAAARDEGVDCVCWSGMAAPQGRGAGRSQVRQNANSGSVATPG